MYLESLTNVELAPSTRIKEVDVKYLLKCKKDRVLHVRVTSLGNLIAIWTLFSVEKSAHKTP
jgi:hypothetical protein